MIFYIKTLLLLPHPFNGHFSRTNWVSRHQKGKSSLGLIQARDDVVLRWQWHQMDHMQTICTSLQSDNHTNTWPLIFWRPDALPDAQFSASGTSVKALKAEFSVLFFSRPRSDGWPHHGRTFSIYPCLLSFWLTLPRRVLFTSWCCPSRRCVAFLACMHLALFLALSYFPGQCRIKVGAVDAAALGLFKK